MVEIMTGAPLGYFSINRFSQKQTTPPHRDGAPDRSILILGYEPTEVDSSLAIADYSRCARKLGLTPKQFLDDFNPMYARGLKELEPFTKELDEFDKKRHQILLINNSFEAGEEGEER